MYILQITDTYINEKKTYYEIVLYHKKDPEIYIKKVIKLN